MTPRTSPLRGLLPYLGLSSALVLVFFGVVMADTHVPVAIEPDAPRAGGAQVATFALGWFWGPDAQFGSLPGVLRTRVGYAGGTKDKPTYRSMGNHTEAIQIEFDPQVISYEKLLEAFWSGHDPFGRAWSTQYKAVLWTHGEAQAKAARKSVAELARVHKRKPTTEVLPATRFWIAEDYHQKYYLRARKGLAEVLLGEKVTDEKLRESTLAARVNGWLTGFGKPAQIAKEVDAFGLDKKARKALQKALGKRSPVLCK